MPGANGTVTETQEAARPQLLVRTSQFLKKVSQLRVARKKSDSQHQNLSYARSARSMDLGRKPLSKVEVRAHHESFDQERGSSESPCHVSLPSGLPRIDPPADIPHTHSPEGLPATTQFLSTPNTTVPLTPGERAQTLPSRSISVANVTRFESEQAATVGPAMRRALAPRLATLPPPMMAGYNAEGRARLTPSLVTRQAPMPLLNLPTLRPPTSSESARPGRPTAPLRSIPALPMQGPSDADQDADHENASLEEDEDEDDGDEHAEGASAEAQDGESGESDDEEDHEVRQPGATEHPLGLGPLPQVDTSRFSVSFADATTASSSRAQPTPHATTGLFVDYFSSKSPEPMFSPMRTPRPADFQFGGIDRVQDVPQLRTVPMPSTPGSPRPGLYHLGSRSMIDLSMTRKEKDKIISPKLGHSLSRKKPRAPVAVGPSSNLEGVEESEPQVETPEDVITSPMLRRRRSLPVYEPSSDPPPYPDQQFLRRGPKPPIVPRDDEGCERLPKYSNTIFLAAVMPRKMEFTQPGVQSKDRKWRRVYCVLEGTMFRVYKAPPAVSTVSAIEQWWESKVGVGDITSVDVTAMTTSGIRVSAVRERARDQDTERPPKIIEEPGTGRASGDANDTESNAASRPSSPQPPPSRSRFHLGSRLLHRQRSKSTSRLGSNHSNSSSRVSIDSRHDNPRPPHAHGRRSMDTLGSSRTSNVSSSGTHVTTSTTLTVPSPPSSASSPTLSSSDSSSRFSRTRIIPHTHSSREHKEKEKEKEATYVPDPKDLLKSYSLQNAESGLASDYIKRKNVIRVRMEGEQFLLQAKDVASVIDWIENIQMGTNVALDLDERPMPRGPIFPRRRRRRPRRVEPAASGS